MIIIDASVAVKWIQHEQESEKAWILRRNHLEGKTPICVPHLLYYEVANALVTKFSMPQEILHQGLDFITVTHLEMYQENESDFKDAAGLARKYKTSFYDMIYAVIAKKHKTILVTADERFVRVTKFPFVKLLSDVRFN